MRRTARSYHDQLRENICVYIIGSKYGIAILADEVASELNPTVTLEYGFMKALDHPVALLRSSTFQHGRADLSSKLVKEFDIRRPPPNHTACGGQRLVQGAGPRPRTAAPLEPPRVLTTCSGTAIAIDPCYVTAPHKCEERRRRFSSVTDPGAVTTHLIALGAPPTAMKNCRSSAFLLKVTLA